MKGVAGVRGWGLMFLLAVGFVLPQLANADAITGLPNTGAAGIGAADSNYALTAPAGAMTAYGISRNQLWVTAPAWSNWIGISAGNVNDPVGLYVYDLDFDLAGLLPSTAVITGDWATDNSAEIFLNGVSTGITKGERGFESLDGFTIGSGFQSGSNRLRFQVTNAGTSGNPSGLLVANLAGTAEAVPVPGAIWMGLSLIGMLFMGRSLHRSRRVA